MSSSYLRRLFAFGKGRTFLLEPAHALAAPRPLSDDLKLFAGTFATGFIFVLVYFS